MLSNIDFRKAIPDAENLKHAVTLYESIPGYKEGVVECGCIAFELEVVEIGN